MSESCKCDDKAKLGATIEFHCQTCSNVTKEISIKKPLKVAAIAAILAYSGSQFADYAITDNRYPLETEYSLLEACISSYQKPLSGSQYRNKKNKCLCALQETMNEISHIRYMVSEDSFLDAFNGNARECK